jgi:hypothetical protein
MLEGLGLDEPGDVPLHRRVLLKVGDGLIEIVLQALA